MKNSTQKPLQVTITPFTIAFTVFFLLALFFLFQIRQILIILFMALIFMAALHPAVKKLQKRAKLPKIVAILLLYVAIISSLIFSFALIIPPLFSELPTLINVLSLPPLPDDIRHLKFSAIELTTLFNQFGSSFQTVFSIISSTFSGVFSVITVLVMTSYLLLERDVLHKKVAWFTRDKKHFALAEELINKLEVELGGWVRGQFLLMVAIGVVTYIGLSLLSVPYALPLAVLAGLLEVLPNLGPTLASIPAIVIAFTMMSPVMAGFVTLFYVVVQQLENNLIVPKIMKDNVDVNPLTTIIVILVGLELSGVIGALLAVPIYILFRSVYSLWLREHRQRKDAETD